MEPQTIQGIILAHPWTTTGGPRPAPFLIHDCGVLAGPNRFIVFAADDAKTHLANTDIWFMDGNFKSCPIIFKQVFLLEILSFFHKYTFFIRKYLSVEPSKFLKKLASRDLKVSFKCFLTLELLHIFSDALHFFHGTFFCIFFLYIFTISTQNVMFILTIFS